MVELREKTIMVMTMRLARSAVLPALLLSTSGFAAGAPVALGRTSLARPVLSSWITSKLARSFRLTLKTLSS